MTPSEPPRLRVLGPFAADLAAPDAVTAPEEPRPELHVVDDAQRRRQRRIRFTVMLFGLVTVVSLLVAVAFHVELAESQMQLDRLNRETATAQQRYQELRLQVAELASPERIIDTAKKKLGMVQAENTTYLSVPGFDPKDSAKSDGGTEDSTASTLARSWPKVKENLAARP